VLFHVFTGQVLLGLGDLVADQQLQTIPHLVIVGLIHLRLCGLEELGTL